MAAIIALPPYALALFIVVVLSLLAGTAAWVFLVHLRRSSLRMPTTQVEAQVQVQVQVEKVHDPTPARSSSWLGLSFAPSTTPSPSDTWIQRILRRHSKEAAGVAPPEAPPVVPTTSRLVDGQPPRPVKKELWLAFDSDATLATLHNDPLGERHRIAPSRSPAPTRAVPATPSLVDDISSPPSPMSFWEPLTPPLVPEGHTSASISSLGSKELSNAVKQDEETDHGSSYSRQALEEIPLSLPSPSSSIYTLIHDTPSLPQKGGVFSPERDMDSDADFKVSCTRLAALIDAISVSFSVSTLGPPFSRRNTKLGFGDCGDDFDDDSSEGDDCDLPHCDDDLDDDEWDLGTATLHEIPSQHDGYSVLAI